jgi:DNA-directed RNA polymerase subunit alpha
MALLTFQKPEKIVMQKATDFEGLFEFRPLEPGFGVTIGNALRRVLLSSLEGFAISNIKIEGVDHEFDTMKGVKEDLTEIILNLKQTRFKRISSDKTDSEKIYVSIKDQEVFKAGDIDKHTSSFTVTNPDLEICHMESFVNLEIELTVEKGRGYVPAEENKHADAPVGQIPIDAIYTPIKNVRYKVENTRVEQRTDYEQLNIEVATDGTLHPEDAIKQAAKIMIQHLMLISDENISFESSGEEGDEAVDEEVLQMRRLLKNSLEDLDLSVRAYNCLKAAKINTLGELVQYNTNELLKFRNFGKKSLVEIEKMVHDKGLEFGMDVSKYKLEED